MKRLLVPTVLAALAFVGQSALSQTVPINVHIATAVQSLATTNPTVAEVSDFTAVADSSGSLAGTYIKFCSQGDAHCYAPWFKVSGTGTAPVITGYTAVEVDITTDDTDSTIAGLLRTTLNAAPYTTYFTITGATTHLIVTNVAKGTATDGNVGTSGFSVSKTQGVSSSLAVASVEPRAMGWRICNQAVQTSTWLAVGQAADTETDGVRLGKGKCYDCPSCSPSTLTVTRVSGQAASAEYSVVQFKQ